MHQQTECQPVSAAAIDSETADVADSSDVLLQYISDSRRLPADMQLVTTASEPMSSSDYKVFVNGNPGECVGGCSMFYVDRISALSSVKH